MDTEQTSSVDKNFHQLSSDGFLSLIVNFVNLMEIVGYSDWQIVWLAKWDPVDLDGSNFTMRDKLGWLGRFMQSYDMQVPAGVKELQPEIRIKIPILSKHNWKQNFKKL